MTPLIRVGENLLDAPDEQLVDRLHVPGVFEVRQHPVEVVGQPLIRLQVAKVHLPPPFLRLLQGVEKGATRDVSGQGSLAFVFLQGDQQTLSEGILRVA